MLQRGKPMTEIGARAMKSSASQNLNRVDTCRNTTSNNLGNGNMNPNQRHDLPKHFGNLAVD